MKGIKDIFKKKSNIIILVVILVVIILFGIIVGFLLKEEENAPFTLDDIYSVYPLDVQNLYVNLVSISCSGDLYFDITEEDGYVEIKDIDKKTLLDYTFGYMSKNALLDDGFNISVIENVVDDLFYENVNLRKLLNNYSYDDYVYTLKDDKITRMKSECKSDNQYVSQLFGYEYENNKLSIDVNFGYLKGNILYDLFDTKLGVYNGDIEELSSLFLVSPHYRLSYVKEDGLYKFVGIQLMRRA